MFNVADVVRGYYGDMPNIPLHAPTMDDEDQRFVKRAIDSGYVSSVGSMVSEFGEELSKFTGSQSAVPVASGTAALHVSLFLSSVGVGDYVITQPLSFVATANAILYCGACPIFLDVDRETLGLCPKSMEAWLEENAFIDDDSRCRLKKSEGIVRACVPMHTFGHPAKSELLLEVCQRWSLAMVEDCAESLGSFRSGTHTGNAGVFGALSFNGNKIITTGGGGAILCDNSRVDEVTHVASTAKKPHVYEFDHDRMGFNYRMPNLNAALGLAQLKKLPALLREKRKLAEYYKCEFRGSGYEFIESPPDCLSNYWLNSIVCENSLVKGELLDQLNQDQIMARPAWKLLCDLSFLKLAPVGPLVNARYFSERLVSLPSSPRFVIN